MKLTVLVDNNTYIDQYFLGEPAVSYYIEDGDEKILFDTGYSDVFIRNAKAISIDLDKLNKIVFSHGHNDHTGGFKILNNQYDLSQTMLISHPDAFREKIFDEEPIGFDLHEESVNQICNLSLSKLPVSISENIIFLGEIPAIYSFEERAAIGKQKTDDIYFDDYVFDDSALVYNGKNGIFIITGCSHSGICNIIEYAKQVCNNQKVLGVIGGFHLFDIDTRLKSTIQYFMDNDIADLYPCHCVSFHVKAEINRFIPIHEVGVGLTIII
ncbi:MBL fold metallo-hydrolase [Anaerocolumna sedimenticola]|uniref:MBL fold metallo-hydrolase n=1 Tax=Anaerocolumna sedimenticola TaxID=2696063 RepID=A0A6P1TS37_9FIRM|nr:MBL fold metallo-hydrolase [Anaerocolumna sedimenticola]QHQ62566.1 MBL fold metallo-hydrolase [Anaerocolumna sedimenticola]